MWGWRGGGLEGGECGEDAHFPLFVNTKSISCLAKLSLTVFLLGRASVFSQQPETGQTRRSGEDAEDGKSARVRSCAIVWKAASCPALPTNSPPLGFTVLTSGQKLHARRMRRNGSLGIIGRQVVWSSQHQPGGLISAIARVFHVKCQQGESAKILSSTLDCRGHLIGRVRCFYRPWSETVFFFRCLFLFFFSSFPCPENTLDKHFGPALQWHIEPAA